MSINLFLIGILYYTVLQLKKKNNNDFIKKKNIILYKIKNYKFHYFKNLH